MFNHDIYKLLKIALFITVDEYRQNYILFSYYVEYSNYIHLFYSDIKVLFSYVIDLGY